jgi:hypothetical protein
MSIGRLWVSSMDETNNGVEYTRPNIEHFWQGSSDNFLTGVIPSRELKMRAEERSLAYAV